MKMFCLGLGAALLATSAHAALTISTNATGNVTCSAGVCTATAADAVLNVGDLTNMLASSALTIQSGSLAQDIVIDAPFSWTSSNALTLDSYHAITVDKPVSDAGPGPLTLTTNDQGTGGMLSFGVKGKIGFASTSNKLTINGSPYILVNSLASANIAIGNKRAGHFALANDYDATPDGTYSISPINSRVLHGTFEGLGNTISHVTIVDHGRLLAGLFGQSGGTIENLIVDKIDITVNHYVNGVVGGLVGRVNRGLLFGDHVQGKITVTKRVWAFSAGGIVGFNGGQIIASPADVSIQSMGGAILGGLAGNSDGTIDSSFATGPVKAPFRETCVGGLVGHTQDGSITNGYAMGAVVGGSPKPIYGQFGDAGGLVGINSSSIGAKTIIASYSTGAVSGRPRTSLGGFLGVEQASVSNGYWDLDTSGVSDPSQGAGSVANDPGITGLTDVQLKSGLPPGFDPTVWAQSPKINNGYPYLIANPPRN